jgi:hypothetical protein
LNVTDAYRNMAGASWNVTFAHRNVTHVRNVTDSYRNCASSWQCLRDETVLELIPK